MLFLENIERFIELLLRMISVYNKISVLVIAADIVKYIEHLKIQLRD